MLNTLNSSHCTCIIKSKLKLKDIFWLKYGGNLLQKQELTYTYIDATYTYIDAISWC